MSWLYLFIIRLAMGERWRKATPADNRYGAGLFFLLAVYFAIGLLAIRLSHSLGAYMQHVGPIGLWAAFVTVVSILVFGSVLWAKHVATRVSVVLAVIAWLVLLSLVFYFEW